MSQHAESDRAEQSQPTHEAIPCWLIMRACMFTPIDARPSASSASRAPSSALLLAERRPLPIDEQHRTPKVDCRGRPHAVA